MMIARPSKSVSISAKKNQKSKDLELEELINLRDWSGSVAVLEVCLNHLVKSV